MTERATPIPDASKPSAIATLESGAKPYLSETVKSALEKNKDGTLLRSKISVRGNNTYALTDTGKEAAKAIYASVSGSDMVSLQAEAHLMRTSINQELRGIRKQERATLTDEWKSAGRRKTGNMDEFNAVLKQRLADNTTVAQYQLERKILSSITQRSRMEAQRESLALAKAAVTEEEILAFSQRLAQEGKRVPNRALLINAIARARIKEKSLEVHEAPVVPTFPIGPLRVEAVPAPENVAPAEAALVPIVPAGVETPHVLSEEARQERSAVERARLAVSRIN